MKQTAVPAPRPEGLTGRRRLVVHGVVQGVGFRPFVFGLARRHGLTGFVRNTSGAVVIEVEGDPPALDAFAAALRGEAPRLAVITGVESGAVAAVGDGEFRIEHSLAVAGQYQPVAPDAATCEDCLGELLDPRDRRHRYPFINCTNCGPRFTIIEDLPYDRPLTTMRDFAMCRPCREEYEDPGNRRFHAQPNACPDCGPRLWYADAATGREEGGDPVRAAAGALRAGAIIAVKGIGGFHLACSATDERAVDRLRSRKHRPFKPFAVMVGDIEAAAALCRVSASESAVLQGAVRPVVLLRRRDGAALAAAVAPGLHELGVMLPYTALHHLLLQEMAGTPLVMTSGNVSDEPIACDNDDAVKRLRGIADDFLLHDRRICARYDDSVVRVVAGEVRMVRRARGYCPMPAAIASGGVDILALGGHLKNTFCVVRDGNAFVGPHIGDLDQPLTLAHQEESLAGYLRLFRVRPTVVAGDLHPDYASTALAERWWDGGAAPVRVQHHHAHIASVMAEHGLRGRLLGVAFDGAGHGTDGSIWGGEFLLCDETGFERVGHLAPVRQPGGDACAREGWRMALSYLAAAGIACDVPPDWLPGGEAIDERRWRLVARVVASTTAAPLSSSAGRLFDAVASLLGVAHHSTFEAEAAMRLEALAAAVPAGAVAAYRLPMSGTPLRLDTPTLVAAVVSDHRRGRPRAEIASAFHDSLATGTAAAARRLCANHGLTRVALSGGVFQNALFLERTVERLTECGLEVYTNRSVPANDGGISLGEALVAAARTGAGRVGGDHG